MTDTLAAPFPAVRPSAAAGSAAFERRRNPSDGGARRAARGPRPPAPDRRLPHVSPGRRLAAAAAAPDRRRPNSLADVGAALETAEPLDVLRWSAAAFGPRLTFATGFGAEGCVLVDLIGRHRLPIDVFTLDTGLLFPETYALWARLEERYGLTIRGVRPVSTVEEQAAAHGPALWNREPDRCCALRKIDPLAAELGRFDAWITAIRRDQTASRAGALAVEWDPKFGLGKVNPLVRWTRQDVRTHLRAHDVPYNPLHDRGFPSIGCRPCTSRAAAGEDERTGRWRGRAKTECGLHAPSGAAGRGSSTRSSGTAAECGLHAPSGAAGAAAGRPERESAAGNGADACRIGQAAGAAGRPAPGREP